MMLTHEDVTVQRLGECRYESPLEPNASGDFVDEADRILYDITVRGDAPSVERPVAFEKAGPRRQLFFKPEKVTAAIVTCGGLCPGLNNVIRSVYLELTHNYGAREVLGIRDGYQGLNPAVGREPLVLTHDQVSNIHNRGGTILGSSRGPQPPEAIVDFLEARNIDCLFCVGGDGTQRGTHAIAEEVTRRGLAKAIVGIPKTIDNDIPFVWMTFGYVTALEKAEDVLRSAHEEACGAPRGVAIVKLMGRHAGFIAAGAAVASQEANFVLVPEVKFPLHGEDGFLAALERRLENRGHALVVVAEGAGQHLFDETERQRDASGNILHQDIGPFLCEQIKSHFQQRDQPISLKYIDPSYIIRSCPANTWDRILANQLARQAVHAAMAGKTDVLVGAWGRYSIYVPVRTVTKNKRELDRSSDLWTGVLSSTGQPRW